MPSSSVILSSCAVVFTAFKLIIPAYRLRFEYTRDPNSNLEPKLWLDAGMSVIFFALSILLLRFSITGQENVVRILLLLAEGILIVYQVSCLTSWKGSANLFQGWISVALLCRLSTLALVGPDDTFPYDYNCHRDSLNFYWLYSGFEDYAAFVLFRRILWNISCIFCYIFPI